MKLADEVVLHNKDDRPECCKAHDKYFSTYDTCEYGELEEKQEIQQWIFTRELRIGNGMT